MKPKNFFAWFCSMVFFASCHAAAKEATATQLSQADNPLVDKIWQVSAKRFVSKEQLLNDIINNNYILLGETHDNPLHHKYQAWVIKQLHNHGRRLAVAFEMITPEQEEVLKKHNVESAEQIFDMLDWDSTCWTGRKAVGHHELFISRFSNPLSAPATTLSPPTSPGKNSIKS